MKIFYTAAVLLQRKFAKRLNAFIIDNWQLLGNIFAEELGLHPDGDPDQQLKLLGDIHNKQFNCNLNWAGTYESAAQNLIRRWELEAQWSL
jgi:hypothetical protein